jgi:hypothetical protein
MRWLVVLFALSVAVIADAKPERPVPPKKASKQQYPDLNYTSNWGIMKIDRDNGEIIIFDHPVWDAEAAFVTPTKVYVLWTLKHNGRLAPGVYVLQTDGTLVGDWGYDEDVEVDTKAWTIKGNIQGDRIYPLK